METLELRMTRKYVGEYKHLDEWKTIGKFKSIGTISERPDEDDYCDPRTDYHILRIVEVEDGVTGDEISQALRDVYSSHGCSHEYDCCGCRSYWASNAERLGTVGGELTYVVTVNSSRNY